MEVPFVDLRAQYESIKDQIDDAIKAVIGKTAFIGGEYVREFENAFSAFCQTKHCIGVGNGTDALFIALKALGIGQGDEVIVPANTFIATSEAVTMTGAKVVFIDVNPDTFNMDAEGVRKALTDKTKAIIPVHLYGQPVDIEMIRKAIAGRDIFVVEDAAQAHGARIGGKIIGGLGDMACFSFYPGKNLGAYGDAGAILTNNDDLAKRARMFANHGRLSKYNHEYEGVNSRLDGLQAAILTVKLKYLDAWTEKRRAIAGKYRNQIKHRNIVLPVEINGSKHVYHLFVIRLEGINRDEFIGYLNKHGIKTGIHYPIGLPFLSAYSYFKCSEKDYPVTFAYQNKIVSLPMFAELTDEHVDYVVEKINEF